MANTNFKHLEYIPLDEDNFITSDKPEVNLKSKSCLNLGFESLNSNKRFIELLKINKKNIKNSLDFLQLSSTLENLLITILNLNTISLEHNSNITSHYKKRLDLISNAKILPSFKYCQDLLFTNFKIWTSYYGTLGYYNCLNEGYKEYQTPSEIVRNSNLSLLKYSLNISDNLLLNTNNTDYLYLKDVFNDVKTLMNTSSYTADKELYNYSKAFLINIPSINSIFKDLRFFESWIPKISNYYKTLEEKDRFIIYNNLDNSILARNLIIQIMNILHKNGLEGSNFVNISSNFIHQIISNQIHEILEKIIDIRKSSKFIIDNSSKIEEVVLINELFQNIPEVNNSYKYFEARDMILNSFAPPGGYSLLLVMLSSMLINRAYILAYTNRLSLDQINIQKVYKRILKLLGFAGILCIKTVVPEIQRFGVNILKSFEIYIENIDSNNLLDL